MKKNRVETTIPEFWFSGHMWIIWELYIDDVIVLIVCSKATLRVRLLFFIKNILGDWFRCIEAIVLKLYIGLVFSCLTNSKCLLLFILIGQGRGIVVHDFIDIHAIVVSYPLVVGNRRLCRGY